eukprot:993767-Pyramimonas_sp.AAC.1
MLPPSCRHPSSKQIGPRSAGHVSLRNGWDPPSQGSTPSYNTEGSSHDDPSQQDVSDGNTLLHQRLSRVTMLADLRTHLRTHAHT